MLQGFNDEARRRLAIALVAATVILLQVSITRILSVVLWYHWAFFAITIAMFGMGAPGVYLSIWKPKDALPKVLLAAAVLVPAGVAGIIHGAPHFGPHGILYSMAALLPGVVALGAAVVVLLLGAPGESVGKMYAWDLVGASVGALLAVPLMWVVPTPQLGAGLGLLPLVAYLLVGGGQRVVAGVIGAGILALCLIPQGLQLRHNKVYTEAGKTLSPIYERWTPTARLTVMDSVFWADMEGGFRWGVGRRANTADKPEQYWLEQDGSAGTPITKFDGNRDKLDFLFDDVTSIAYEWRAPQRVAIVGGGGGRDILSAYYGGATDIDAIEINGGIVEALRGEFREFSGGVYDLPGVHAVIEEGRSALTRSRGGYDLIQISMIDSWAATAAGAYSLSENNLYTVEAFRLYWDRLSDDGVLSTSRWMAGEGFGLEIFRLLLLCQEMLRQVGVENPSEHLVVVEGGRVGTIMVTKKRVEPVQVARLRKIIWSRGFDIHHPHKRTKNWVDFTLEEGLAKYTNKGFVLTPPVDDKPFFFQMLSPFRTPPKKAPMDTGTTDSLRRLMQVTTLVTLLVFFFPFAMRRRIERGRDFWRGSAFFTAIGLSFMAVEIAWLQRFVLYVGHPSLATTVALGSMLLGAGLGSMTSARLGVERGQRFGFVAAGLILVLNLVMGPIFTATLGLPWLARILVSILLIVPAAYLMGFFFPLGMMRFGDASKAWYWALNGAAGVLASVTSLAFAMELGFRAVAMIGAGLYLVAWLLLRGTPVTPVVVGDGEPVEDDAGEADAADDVESADGDEEPAGDTGAAAEA